MEKITIKKLKTTLSKLGFAEALLSLYMKGVNITFEFFVENRCELVFSNEGEEKLEVLLAKVLKNNKELFKGNEELLQILEHSVIGCRLQQLYASKDPSTALESIDKEFKIEPDFFTQNFDVYTLDKFLELELSESLHEKIRLGKPVMSF